MTLLQPQKNPSICMPLDLEHILKSDTCMQTLYASVSQNEEHLTNYKWACSLQPLTKIQAHIYEAKTSIPDILSLGNKNKN